MPGVIPTLFLNQMEISTPQDIAAYLLKFLIHNPGWTSSQIESTLLSMRKFVAETAEDVDMLPETIQSTFTAALDKYFPGYKVQASATRQTATTYALLITIRDSVGTPLLTTDDFIVEDGEFKLRSEVRDTSRN